MKKLKNILVTGGAGFIGSHTVVSLVEKGYRPIIVDHFGNADAQVLGGLEKILGFEPVCYNVDCCDAQAMKGVFEEEEIDAVIHFAAWKAVGESMRKPLKYYGNNVHSMVVLLDTMREFDVKHLVFSSSCTVYSDPEELPITEQSPFRPYLSPYGHTKQICEMMVQDLVESGSDLKTIMLRYFNPIGAHPTALIGELPLGEPNNLIPYITQTAVGERASLTIFGKDYPTPDGTCIRDYIHVMDVADAHVQSLVRLEENTESIEAFNLGTGKGSSVQEVVDTFEEISGVKLAYTYGPQRKGDVAEIFAAVDKAERDLHWKTKRTLRDALEDSWRWQQTLG